MAPEVSLPHNGSYLGGSTHVTEVAEALIENGYTVYVLGRRGSKDKAPFERIAEDLYIYRVFRGLIVPVDWSKAKNSGGDAPAHRNLLSRALERVYFATLYRIALVVIAIRIMTRHRVSVVLERNSAKGVGRIAAWLLRVPFLEEVIDPDYCRSAVRTADRVITYTPKVLRGLVPDERIVLTTAGANLEIFKPVDGTSVREKYGLSGKKVIVYVGSASSWHGIGILVCAMAFLPDDYRALIVCQTSEDLAKSAALIGVSDRIFVTGFVKHDEVPAYICAADVAVAPYEPAGLRNTKEFGFYFSPLKLFEYMACGRPVVASDVDLVREVVSGSGCGLLVHPSDPWMLARGIAKVVDLPDKGGAMGIAGRKACTSKYNWDAVGRQIAVAIRGCQR